MGEKPCMFLSHGFLILYITKRLVWADNMLCVPEQLVDSDVVAQERARITW